MNRLLFFPQYPVYCRYQQFWYNDFPKHLGKYFDVKVMGESYIEDYRFKSKKEEQRGELINFAPLKLSLDFENYQVSEFLRMDISPDDYILFTDLSFQESSISQLYYVNYNKKKASSFCHGTSRNKYDIFQKNRSSKWLCETAHSKLFNKVFVSTEYHKEKLDWDNIDVIGLPENPIIQYLSKLEKDIDIISVARPCVQKITKKTEDYVEKNLNISIVKGMANSWINYCRLLSRSKVLLISSKEDTFNYTILDALKCGCIPVAPNRLCFPEILPDYLLYNNDREASEIVDRILSNKIQMPVNIKNRYLVDNFYENLKNKIMEE
jgi:hypothetical protein